MLLDPVIVVPMVDVHEHSIEFQKGIAEVHHPAEGDVGQLFEVALGTLGRGIIASAANVDVVPGEPALDEVCLGEGAEG